MISSTDQAALDRFYSRLDEEALQPLWTQETDLMPVSPRPAAIPWLWRWETLRPLAEEAGRLITVARGGDRRVLSLSNPGLGGLPFASPTLWAAVQYLNAGESAPAHRHTPSAIRFVMEGSGVWTTVNGDACDMNPGDLVLTPSWTWHDHNSGGDGPMVWFDGLDLPLIKYFDAVFFENFPDELLQPVDGEHNHSQRLYGTAGIRPVDVDASGSTSPLLVFRWADTDAALNALQQERDGPIVSIGFVNPVSGAAIFPTLNCEMHRLIPERRTPTTRTTGSRVFVVYEGTGSTVVEGQRFDWRSGDMFVVPSWASVDHEAQEPSDLFSIDDSPPLKALGLYRHEESDRPQEVVSVFAD